MRAVLPDEGAYNDWVVGTGPSCYDGALKIVLEGQGDSCRLDVPKEGGRVLHVGDSAVDGKSVEKA
jgi:hypothetical protein